MYWSPQGSHQEPYGGSGSRPCQQWQLTAPGKGDLGKVVVVVCGVLVDAHVDEWVGRLFVFPFPFLSFLSRNYHTKHT